MTHKDLTIHIIHLGRSVTFKLDKTGLTIKYIEAKFEDIVTYHRVIFATFDHATQFLEVAYMTKRGKKDPLLLVKIQGKVQDIENDVVVAWTDVLMHTAYEGSGVKRAKRLKVLVNPHSGIRKGALTFTRTVEPIFRTAGCSLDVIYTTHNGHAYDIAKSLALDYDAIITVSGDGLIHEVMNGFAHHEDPRRAFTTPIAPIPTGSGNGLALNLLGIEKGLDAAEAALNVVKGRPMKVDVFSLTQNGKRTVSFMSQALGLMADLDIGTENLRWMGDARFMVGLIRGVIQFKPCPVQLSFKVAEHDKTKMAEALQARRQRDRDSITVEPLVSQESDSGELPALTYLPDDSDGWTTFDEPLLYIYAGKGPYVGRDFMAFPVSLPDDGLIDVMAMPVSSRTDILSSLKGAVKGENYWHPKLHYIKAHAYRVKPLAAKGSLAVDGEIFPFEEFQVEVHQKLATLLSPHGYYAADFYPRSVNVLSRTTEGKSGSVTRGNEH